ncbi:MAG: antibiotic biosynthesis monooxygenase [Anaerolineales bacterium]|nr:antibiotic biosynthesis monooxygenase [Anaerolineales bacterium]
MYIIIWEYHVKTEKQAEFEQIYSSPGTWADLFRKAKGYLGTELLHDESDSQRYLTLDRWASKADYEIFLKMWEQEYKALDARCEGLTEQEAPLGKFEFA